MLPCGKIREKELVNRAHKQRRKIKSRKSSLYDEKTVAKLLFAFSINDQKEFESILESGNFTREEKMIAKFWSIVIKQTIAFKIQIANFSRLLYIKAIIFQE